MSEPDLLSSEPATKYWIECARCKEKFHDWNDGCYWFDAADLYEWWDDGAFHHEWQVIDEKPCCPECWTWAEDEETIIFQEALKL